MELQERTRQWLATPMPTGNKSTYFQELNTLYFEITGTRVTCTGCNYYPMKAKIESFAINSNPITQPKTITMATTSKYRFTSKARNEKISIILHLEGVTKAINATSLTDKDAEFILTNKSLNAAYGHNIEENPDYQEEPEPSDNDLEDEDKEDTSDEDSSESEESEENPDYQDAQQTESAPEEKQFDPADTNQNGKVSPKEQLQADYKAATGKDAPVSWNMAKLTSEIELANQAPTE